MSRLINNILDAAMATANYESAVKHSNEISSILKENENSLSLVEIPLESLFEMEKTSLQLTLNCKRAIYEQTIKTNTKDDNEMLSEYNNIDKDEILAIKNNVVTVDVKDKEIIIHTPYVFRRAFGKDYTYRNFQMANFVAFALIKWAKENGKEVDEFYGYIPYFDEIMPARVSVIVTRYSDKFKRSVIADNDNIETGRIINIVYDFMCRNDNARNMDFVSRYRETDDKKLWGTEFKFVPTDNLKDYL